MQILLLIFLLTICAGFIQRVSGFGFGIFVMMFFPVFLPSYGESAALSGLLAGSTALVIAIRNFKHIQWSVMLYLLVTNIIVSFLAIEYMASMSGESLKKCFGAMFVLIAIYFLFVDGRRQIPQNGITKTLLGALSGIMGGMFAMPGPPIVLYCINCIKDKMAYIATLQAFSVVLNVFYSAFRARVGFFADDIMLWWSVGIVGGIIGTVLGSCLFSRIDGNMLKKIVYVLLLVSGVVAMI